MHHGGRRNSGHLTTGKQGLVAGKAVLEEEIVEVKIRLAKSSSLILGPHKESGFYMQLNSVPQKLGGDPWSSSLTLTSELSGHQPSRRHLLHLMNFA
jgi:hypothetical protein